jgi:hypothetical protein
MIFRRIPRLAFCLALPALAGATELLHFDFEDSAHLAAEPGPLPAGEILNAVSPSREFPGSADFHGGTLRRPAFPAPQGPFSIEARFRIRTFAPEGSRFVANIVNTATWDNAPTQGFAFEVGGAYLYPVVPRNAYRTDAEWADAQAAYSHTEAGRLSVCLPTFAMARRDSQALWKKVFADRCIEPNAWTHAVGVWDGNEMRLYLNGMDASDPWRVTGAGAPPRLDSAADLYVGARNAGAWDMVPFNGVIDYVKIEDRALTAAEVHERYRATFVPEKRDSLCTGVIVPVYPEAGQICKGTLRFEVRVSSHGACTDPAFIAGILAGDSVEIELAKDPSFDTVAVRARFAVLAFELGTADLGALAGYGGPIYWRVRLLRAGARTALAKVSAGAEEDWSLARPIVLEQGVVPVRPPSAPKLRRAEKGLLFPGSREPQVFDLGGRRLDARFRLLPGAPGVPAVWRLEDLPAGSDLLWVR